MKRILFVNKSGLGGPANSLIYLLDSLKKQYEISVILGEKGILSEKIKGKGIPVIFHKVRYRSIPFLVKLLRQKKIDIVYANSFTAAAWRVLIASKIARRKFIWHIREILNVDKVNPYRVRRRVRFADQVIAVSDACRKSVKLISPKTPVTVIYNGVDPDDFDYEPEIARNYIVDQFDLSDKATILLSVGTMTPRKNQYDAILAIKQIVNNNPNVHLFLVGHTYPDYVEKINNLTKNLNLKNNVHITGFRRDIPKLLCGADLLIHTALVDPHPRAVLEAMAAGIPVVAYDVDGVSETLINGESGFLIQPGDIRQLELRIMEIIYNRDLKQSIVNKASQTVCEQFSYKKTADDVIDVIENVLHGQMVND